MTKSTRILKAGRIQPRLAEKLAGRLNFAAGAVAGQSGSARINELYKIAFGRVRNAKIGHRLKRDLEWWRSFLLKGQCLRFRILGPPKKKVIVYTDAQGRGGIGAAIISGSTKLFFKETMDQRFLSKLIGRETQIIPLEAIAVLVALHRFKREIGQCDLVLLIDNTSVLGATRKGRSSADDVHEIVTAISDLCFEINVTKHLFWVPSAMNIADAPSRGEDIDHFDLVHDLKSHVARSVGVVSHHW